MLKLNSFQLGVLQQIENTRLLRSIPYSEQMASVLSRSQYWLEIGATIAVLPRTSGKTTLCKYLVANQPSTVLLDPTRTFESIRGKDGHLIVDEYQSISSEILKKALEEVSWKSVLLIGTQIL